MGRGHEGSGTISISMAPPSSAVRRDAVFAESRVIQSSLMPGSRPAA